MKKIKFIVLFIFILMCCGCSYKYAGTTRTIRHSGFNMTSGKFTCSPIYDKKEIKDRIKLYVGNYMISENGNIYEVSLGKEYSNEMNCKKPDFDVKIKAIYDLSIIKGSDNKYYYVGGTENAAAFSEVSESDEDYGLYDILLGDDGVIKVSTVNAKDLEFYVLKDDGNIYQYKVSKTNDNKYLLDSNSVIYSRNDYGYDIVDFNYNGSNSTTFVKTTNNYYRMKVTNSDECYKYADVSCKYEMMIDKELTKVKDNILAYNGSSLVTTYGAMFNVAN